MAEAFAKMKLTDQAPPKYHQAVENSVRATPLGYVVNSHHIKYPYRFEEEIKTYELLIDSLERALSKPLFCCSGSLQLSDIDKCNIKVMPTKSDGADNWKEFALSNLDVDQLLEYCNPAPFGDLKEMKTVLDPEVRLAYEIQSTSFKAFVPFILSILGYIEDKLTPGRCVHVEPYKLNVYGEGGFFKPHVDNPTGHDMIGTLVVCLPSPHKGGELHVYHDGLQHVFDFSKHSGDTSRVQWAAFYSDCIHEVKPVLEGHRVTITYNITTSEWFPQYEHRKSHPDERKKPDPPVEHVETGMESPSLTSKALADVNKEIEKILRRAEQPCKVGFLLKHKYISRGLQPCLLKGEDKGFYDYLVEKEWKCKLMSVLSRYQTSEIILGEDLELEETHEIYEFNPLAPSKHPGLLYDAPLKGGSSRWLHTSFRRWRVGIPFIEIYRNPTENSEFELVRDIEGFGSWVGNEVEDVGVDKIYLDSAVIVELTKEPQYA